MTDSHVPDKAGLCAGCREQHGREIRWPCLTIELGAVHWTKVDRDSDDCVEVAFLNGGLVALRNSIDPDSPTVAFTPSEWTAFTDAVRAGEFR
ncbi:hypothetical protein Val02_67400 [Virgisporangium aliadipatigenens]|uniref:DUF397 domain-containing protein n=1 Tax=Virgisporangium aliadipatigenens TaxID=741659 RepID=A0A8J4DTK3_9ACTN|nr:DUF397 domain-containing protein [Virgisporangium aliadipatigenens]GIJ49854.1 hypothetical protein Val02_67400 [Virgisporangium aliadipatigenens]